MNSLEKEFTEMKFNKKSVIALSALICTANTMINAADALPQTTTPSAYLIPQENLSLSINEIKTLQTPFKVVDATSSAPACVKVLKWNEHEVQIQALSSGTATISASASGITKSFKITVLDNMMPVYKALRRDLADIPAVSVELREGIVTLRGEITRYDQWELFDKVVSRQKDNIQNYVTFHAGPELMSTFRDMLVNAGYKIEDKVSPDNPGSISLKATNGVLTLTGYFLSDHDIDAVTKLIDTQKWLSTERTPNTMPLILDINVTNTQIDVGIVFVGITKSDAKRLGNSTADGTLLSVDIAAWFKSLYGEPPSGIGQGAPKKNGPGGIVFLDTNLKGAIKMFGSNGISEFRDAGHITFTSNSKSLEESSFENGGTLSIPIAGRDTADLKEIDFGLKFKIKGGMVQGNDVRLVLDLEKSLPPVKVDKDYLQRKTKAKTEIICSLDTTAVIAGQKEFSIVRSGPSGMAFLRHVPVVNWFVSGSEEQLEDLQLLILVSPQMVKNKLSIEVPPSVQTENTEEEVTKTINAQEIKSSEEKGFFGRMFSW